MIPYYFDIPELELPEEILSVPYRQHPSDFMSPSGLGMGGTIIWENPNYKGDK